MFTEDINRSFVCPKCGKTVLVSIGQLEWSNDVKCKECSQTMSMTDFIAANKSKYETLMK